MDRGPDFELMNRWQRGFPLASRPYADIGGGCGLAESEVMERFGALLKSGFIDRIGPVFRPNTVGASTLAAMAVPPERLERVAAAVGAHAGVNHNYEREHAFNLWFVVTAPAAADVERTLLDIEAGAGLVVLRLPLLEEFHIDLGFDLQDGESPREEARRVETPSLAAGEKALVAALAAGLPLVPRPYAALGLPEAFVIDTLRRWLDAGIVRRIGAVVRHRRLGYDANAMVVWDVPGTEVAAAGRRLAADAAVTLCYRRPRALPDWRYNLFCMVHGRARPAVLYDIKRMSALHGLGRYPRAILFSRRCFNQRAARYG
jgi:DNA-binding Lrp family transcriptional regulator